MSLVENLSSDLRELTVVFKPSLCGDRNENRLRADMAAVRGKCFDTAPTQIVGAKKIDKLTCSPYKIEALS